MVITELRARVEEDRRADLQSTFSSFPKLPTQILSSSLLQDHQDPAIWKIVTVWQSAEALEEYKSSVETPGGVLMFRSVGAEPEFTLFNVRHTSAH